MTRMAELRAWFADQSRALVALSGGVDSALVAYAAHHESPGSIALTANYAALPRDDLDAARKTCKEIGIRHMIIEYDELLNKSYVANGSDRCFHCRSELGMRLGRAAADVSASVIVDGTHLDDMGDYRPGLEAMREADVRSPLAEVGFTKADVRECAREVGLSTSERPANSCLASRIPWGRRVTAERLARIEIAERIIHQESGIGTVRVRDTGDASARIEVMPSDIAELRAIEGVISPKLRMIGYADVTIDPDGYSRGSASTN